MTSRPAYPPSLADWADYRSIIKRLYVEDEYSLSQVQEILCRTYHFKASLRSYKNKLRSWGVRKYYRAQSSLDQHQKISFEPVLTPWSTTSDGRFSPGRVKHEDAETLTTDLSHTISPVSTGLEDTLPRKRTTSPTRTPRHGGRALVERRPSSTSSILCTFIISDDITETTESVILATKAFTDTFSELAAASPTSITDVTSPGPTKPFRRRKNYIWHRFQHSLALLEQAKVSHGFAALQSGCAMAETYLRCPTRQTLTSLLLVMGNRRWSRHRQAWTSVVRFLASMAVRALGPRHPLAHILTCLAHRRRATSASTEGKGEGDGEEQSLLRAIAQPTLRVLLDDTYAKSHHDASHPEMLILKQALSVELMRAGDFDASEALVLELCALATTVYGPTSLARRNCLRRLGNLYLEDGPRRWVDAEAVFELVLALDVQANDGANATDETSVFTCQNLSLLSWRRGDARKSEQWARRELQLAERVYGVQDEYCVDCRRRWEARMAGQSEEMWFSWLEVS